METNIAPGLRFSILDREFKKKLEERANLMGLTAVQLRVLGEVSRLESMGACEINQTPLAKSKRSTLFHHGTYDGRNIFNFIDVFSNFWINGSYMFLIVIPGFHNQSASFRAR